MLGCLVAVLKACSVCVRGSKVPGGARARRVDPAVTCKSGGRVVARHDIIRDELYFLAGKALTHSSFHVEREVPLNETSHQMDIQKDETGRGIWDDKVSKDNRRLS